MKDYNITLTDLPCGQYVFLQTCNNAIDLVLFSW